jgi:hypothetical protein
MFCRSLTILGIGLSWGSARAQTKLVKPAKGGSITISQAGSYYLPANIASTLLNYAVIKVNANNVTINLNGFTIAGPGGSGTGTAINASGDSGVTVINGTIAKMPATAIILGSNSTVGGVQLIGNGGDGVDCTSACLISNSVITGNTGAGLSFSDSTSGYESNIISGNGTTAVSGTNMGHNVCNGTSTCP